MKNIHVLPTDKPSRLHEFGNIWFSHKEPTKCFRNYNIYITSNEKPKKGEWSIYLGLQKKYKVIEDIIGDEFPKIILTTDPDLIAEGVQAIDDKFLEWFVKNPSCEFVEVEKKDNWYTHTGSGKYWEDEPVRMKRLLNLGDYEYKIIIPQEEAKQLPKSEIDWSGFPKSTKDKVGYKEPKQDSLKESFERFMESNGSQIPRLGLVFGAFSAGSEWRAEIMYSLEEVINIQKEWNDFNEEQNSFNGQDDLTFEEWFNQFKKK